MRDGELSADQVLVPWLVVEVGMRESYPYLYASHNVGTTG